MGTELQRVDNGATVGTRSRIPNSVWELTELHCLKIIINSHTEVSRDKYVRWRVASTIPYARLLENSNMARRIDLNGYFEFSWIGFCFFVGALVHDGDHFGRMSAHDSKGIGSYLSVSNV